MSSVVQLSPTVSPYSTGTDASDRTIAEGFPEADPQFKPYGARVVVQLRRVMTKSKGGIILSQDTKDTEAWNEQVGRLVSVGPLAFRNRNSLEEWPEGIWGKPGDFVKVPRYGGDRWSVPAEDGGEPVVFLCITDKDLIGQHLGNPMAIKAYVA